jgi:SAM-dependent methyltransferase
MSCATHCDAIDGAFDDVRAKQDLNRYRQKGPNGPSRLLLGAIREAGVTGATVLDVGGGVGALTHELLASGVAEATLVDASASYVAAAHEEAERRGHADRLNLRCGDFVALSDEIPVADVVTLDRVICCYPDMERIVAVSTKHARRLYGVVYPRDAWWVRFVTALGNVARRFRGTAFRVYIFPAPAIDAAIRREGWTHRFVHRGFVWQVALYERARGG